jgi:hypothetical protein
MDMILKAVVPAGEVATAAQVKAVEEELSEKVKAALLISGANRHRYGGLKDSLANNYLLGSNQYPDTFGKAMHILGNYQTMKASAPYRAIQTTPEWHFCREAVGVAAGQVTANKQATETRPKSGMMEETATT